MIDTIMKTGIFYLVDKNQIYNLKTSLYFLFKNFNHNFKHNVYLMFRHGEMSKSLQDELRMSVRENSRDLINFMELDIETFKVPKHIDEEVFNRILDIKPIIDWGDRDERLINYFWIVKIWDYVKDFDYIMKMDCDLFIEEPIREDFFKIIQSKGYNMMFNMLKSDCPISNFGLKEILDQKYPEKTSEISQFFSHSKLTEYNSIESFKNLYKVANKTEYKKADIDLYQPIVCQDCFYITKVSFWNSAETKDILQLIDRLGFIFYYKWSLSSIISLVPMVQDKEKLSRCVFKMSKEFHRVSMKDSNDRITSKMPISYDLTGCITSR